MQVTGERWRETPWWRLFGSIFLVTFALIAIWSVAMPLVSGPDEAAHIVKASGAARGEFVGQCNDTADNPRGTCAKSSPFTEMYLPAFYSLIRNGGNIPGTRIPHHGFGCFSKRIDIPASCVIVTPRSVYLNLSRNAWTYVGRYPPLYYVIVGFPTLLGSGLWALYLMRFASAALSALMLSCAIFSILRYSRNRLLLLGVSIAVTPMAIYLAGVINPNGLEATSALSLWTILTVLVYEQRSAPPRSLVAMGTLSALVFVSTRSLSPLWLALLVIFVLAGAGLGPARRLFSNRDVMVASAIVFLVGLADLFWIVYEHSTVLNVSSQNAQALIPSRTTSEWTILATSFHHNIYYLPGMIGVFGSFDTYAPHATFVIWYLLGGLMFALGLIAGNLRQRAVLGIFGAGILLIPVLISTSQARKIGYVWSGRDALPFAIGLPVVCASFIDRGRVRRFLQLVAPFALLLAWVAQAWAFFAALRRYSVGDRGPSFTFLFHSPWCPPAIGCLWAFVIEVVILGAGYALVLRALGIGISGIGDRFSRQRRPEPSDREQAGSTKGE